MMRFKLFFLLILVPFFSCKRYSGITDGWYLVSKEGKDVIIYDYKFGKSFSTYIEKDPILNLNHIVSIHDTIIDILDPMVHIVFTLTEEGQKKWENAYKNDKAKKNIDIEFCFVIDNKLIGFNNPNGWKFTGIDEPLDFSLPISDYNEKEVEEIKALIKKKIELSKQ